MYVCMMHVCIYIYEAVERCIPDFRARAEFHIIGSPLAHEVYIYIYAYTYLRMRYTYMYVCIYI